jgi:hypothetical protein
MIIRASDLPQDELSPERVMAALEDQRKFVLEELPDSLLDQEDFVREKIEFVAAETMKSMMFLLKSLGIEISGKLFSTRIIHEKREQLKSLLDDGRFIRKVGNFLEKRFEYGNGEEELAADEWLFLKKISKRMVSAHVRVYFRHLLDDMDELFLEREQEEREMMERYFPQQNHAENAADSPDQLLLF